MAELRRLRILEGEGLEEVDELLAYVRTRRIGHFVCYLDLHPQKVEQIR